MRAISVLATLSLMLVPSYSVRAKELPNIFQLEIRQPTAFEQQQLEEYHVHQDAQIRQFNSDIRSSLEQNYENKMKWGNTLNEIQQRQLRMERDRINRPPQLPNRFFR